MARFIIQSIICAVYMWMCSDHKLQLCEWEDGWRQPEAMKKNAGRFVGGGGAEGKSESKTAVKKQTGFWCPRWRKSLSFFLFFLNIFQSANESHKLWFLIHIQAFLLTKQSCKLKFWASKVRRNYKCQRSKVLRLTPMSISFQPLSLSREIIH